MKVAQRKTVNTPLAVWLNANGMTMREFGRRIGIPHSKLSGIIDGRAMPSILVAYEMERLTQGEVPIESWLGITFARGRMAALRAAQPTEYQPESFRAEVPEHDPDNDEKADSEEDGDDGPEAEGEDAFE